MNYEETLAALLGLVGKRIDVAVTSVTPPGMIGAFSGVLAQGTDLTRSSHNGAGSEALRFVVAGDVSGTEGGVAAYIVLDPEIFDDAEWEDGTAYPRALSVRLGAVELVFEPTEMLDAP